MSLKSIIKKHKKILILSAFIYSIVSVVKHTKYIINGKIKCEGAFLRNVRFKLSGNSIKIRIGAGSVLSNCSFLCKGDNITITIKGEKTYIRNSTFCCEDNGSNISIEKYFTMEGGHIASTEGEKITIGEDCMFSNDIEIRNGDSHTIYNICSQERINHAQSVKIGNHVWLCAHSRILKGSVIPNDCIIGNSTIISGDLKLENSIYAGLPARKVKGDISWSRTR